MKATDWIEKAGGHRRRPLVPVHRHTGRDADDPAPVVDKRAPAVSGMDRGVHLDHVFEGATHVTAGDAHVDRGGLGAASQWKAQGDQGGKFGNYGGFEIGGQGQCNQSRRDGIDLEDGEIVTQGGAQPLPRLDRQWGHADNGHPACAPGAEGRLGAVNIFHRGIPRQAR